MIKGNKEKQFFADVQFDTNCVSKNKRKKKN